MTRSLFVLLVAAAVPGSLVTGCTPTRSADASPARGSAASAPNAAAASAASEAPPAAVGAKVYAKPSEAELIARLTPLQFEVTQRAATEPPFQNAYWNNHEAGLYVDVATGEPLFSSRDKFESGTGWPSFTRPVDGGHVVEHHDFSLGMARTEVLSKAGASHLGHVFDDGPAPDNLRYCINSASLRFVPASRLAAEGYGAYAPSFGLEAPKQVAPSSAASNSCTLPPPGKAPGCKATLETAIFAPAPGDDTRAKTPGILDLARGHEGAEPAVEVTYDPAKLTYEALLTAWTSGRPAARVYARNDAQKQAAAAKALKPADAVPFRRE